MPPELRSQHDTAPPVQLQYHGERRAAAAMPLPESPGAYFKMYLLRQFCSNRVEFLLQYTGDADAKNDGPEFWNSNFVIFENFLKFSKRLRAVPLRPMYNIMVAAKLDQSRVPVTKFHQNRLTLKVAVPVRDTQTDRQTRLKIMALQVCNRANISTQPKPTRVKRFKHQFWPRCFFSHRGFDTSMQYSASSNKGLLYTTIETNLSDQTLLCTVMTQITTTVINTHASVYGAVIVKQLREFSW